MTRPFVAQISSGNPAQLSVNQWQQAVQSSLIAAGISVHQHRNGSIRCHRASHPVSDVSQRNQYCLETGFSTSVSRQSNVDPWHCNCQKAINTFPDSARLRSTYLAHQRDCKIRAKTRRRLQVFWGRIRNRRNPHIQETSNTVSQSLRESKKLPRFPSGCASSGDLCQRRLARQYLAIQQLVVGKQGICGYCRKNP